MTAAAPRPTPPPIPPSAPLFVGRQQEGRAVILSARAGRSVLLVAPTGYGKSALLAELAPTLDTLALTLRVPKVAPFGTFLLDLAAALIDAGQPIPGGDLAGWKKANAGNDAKTRSLVQALRDYGATGATPPVLLIDDATGLTQSMVPALLALTDHAALICAVQPEVTRKVGLTRFFQRCDRVDLTQLSRADARALVDDVTARYNIVAEDMSAYKNRVLSMSEGVPGEVVRLVRYVSTHDLVTNKDIGSTFAQQAAQRQERGVALAPLLLVLGGVAMVTKYVGLARGEMDMYLMGGVGIAVFMVAGPWLRKLVTSR
jgi:hypothetical protein